MPGRAKEESKQKGKGVPCHLQKGRVTNIQKLFLSSLFSLKAHSQQEKNTGSDILEP